MPEHALRLVAAAAFFLSGFAALINPTLIGSADPIPLDRDRDSLLDVNSDVFPRDEFDLRPPTRP